MNSLLEIIKEHKKGTISIGAAIIIIASVGAVGYRAYMAKVQNDNADSVVEQMTNQVSKDFTSSFSNDKEEVKGTITKLEVDKARVKAQEAGMTYADDTNGSSSILAKIDAQIKSGNQKLSEIEAKDEAAKKAAEVKKKAEEAAKKAKEEEAAKKVAEAKKAKEEAAKKAAEAKKAKEEAAKKVADEKAIKSSKYSSSTGRNNKYYYGYYTFDKTAHIDSMFDPNWGAIRTDYLYDPSYKRWVIFNFDHRAEGALSHHSDLYKKLLPVFDAHFSVPTTPAYYAADDIIIQRMYVYVGK